LKNHKGFIIYDNSRKSLGFISDPSVEKNGNFSMFFYSVVREELDYDKLFYIRGIKVVI